MSEISGIQGMPTNSPSLTNLSVGSGRQAITGGNSPQQATGNQVVSSVATTQTGQAASAFMSTEMAAANNNQLLGAVLLMLMAEYMNSDDDEEKKGLLGLMGLMIGQQQSSGSQIMMSSSLNLESVQMHGAAGAYNGAAANFQQAPQTDAGAAGLDVSA
jgi:lipopolysaccharide biosynthesis regulator YciM